MRHNIDGTVCFAPRLNAEEASSGNGSLID